MKVVKTPQSFPGAFFVVMVGVLFLVGLAHSQNSQPEIRKVPWDRSITLLSYSVGRNTTVDFRGTEQMITAKGTSRVKIERGAAQIDARFQDVLLPPIFGPEYTTFVLWAVAPDSSTTNLGEIAIRGYRGRIKTSVPLQTFALIVTAEPYSAITVPSNVIVMANVAAKRNDAAPTMFTPTTLLIDQGAYAVAGLEPYDWESPVPPDLFQARNAVRLAEWQGAGRYVAGDFEKAQQALRDAELEQQQSRSNRSRTVQLSRQAMQLAEGSRVIALQRMEEERLEIERAEAAQRAAAAETSRLAAMQEAARQGQLRAEAQAEREAIERLAAHEAEKARLEAEQARKLMEQAEEQIRRLEASRQELRSRLLKQFNMIMETRDSANGLILSMGDVLFDVGRSELHPEAREKLAQLSGVLFGHPTLKLEIGGHTDTTGRVELNQRLSEQRAEAVRSYLVSQNVPTESVTAQGFGETMPIASNDTARGRRQNRRVEITVSGEALGDPLGSLY